MTDMSWMPWVVGGVMVLSFLYMKKYLLLLQVLYQEWILILWKLGSI